LCGSFDGVAIFTGGASADVVDAHPSTDVLQLGVSGPPILVSRPFVNKLVEFVVTDFLKSLRFPDTSLVHGLADRLRHRPIVDASGPKIQALTISALYGCNNAGPSRDVAFPFKVTQAHTICRVVLQLKIQVRR